MVRWNRFLNGLNIFRAGVQEQMNVHINKAGHEYGCQDRLFRIPAVDFQRVLRLW